MTQEIKAPQPAAPAPQPAPDMAPSMPIASAAADAALVSAQSQALIQTEPTKRSKTGGERLFDLTTYGGLGLIGNEATASYIVGEKESANFIGRAYRRCDEFLKNVGKPGKLPYLQQRMNYISFAIIGGFVMVPFIKWLEDNKGRCVRFADRIIHGEEANNPEIAKRHEEMDNAPKQSWSSLGKGRIVTVAAAYTVDSTINWKDGLLARALKGTRFENHASAEHLSDHASNWLDKQVTAIRNTPIEKAAGQKKFIGNLVSLTTLSAMLTVLFYISSKIFAKKRDEKIDQRYETLHHPRDEAQADEIDLEKELTKVAERPRTQVSGVDREATVSAAPQLATSI